MPSYEELGQPTGAPNPMGERDFAPYMTLRNGVLYEGGVKVPADRAISALETYIVRQRRALDSNRSQGNALGGLISGVVDYETRPQLVNAMKILEALKARGALDAARAEERAKSGAR